MRFNCGESPGQKRARKRAAAEKKEQARCERLREWHYKFAWWPVRLSFDADGNDISNTCVWLELVRRRGHTEFCALCLLTDRRWKWVYREGDPRDISSNYY